MSARRQGDAGAFSTYVHAANDEDFLYRRSNKADPGWKDPMQLRVMYPADLGEAMSAVEDLWLRLARHKAVRSAVLSDAPTSTQLVLFRLHRDGGDSECYQLLAAASSLESYWWHQDAGRASLVSDILWQGETLVIELISRRQMRRWPEGEAAEWSMQSLLQRMRQLGRQA